MICEQVHTEYYDMADADIFEWPRLRINVHFVEFIQSFEAFDDMPKDGMFPIEVINIIRQRDKELTSTSAQGFAIR